jgi:DNA-binding transcriptional regulator YdaS (Cro superfamily)
MTKEKAIAIFGSVRALADALGITEQAVNQWKDEIPPLRAYQIRDLVSARKTKKDRAGA